jgi:hypothetical protein
MRFATARTFALGLPVVTEEPHFDLGSWRVRGKIIATLPPGGERLRIYADPEEVRALVAAQPEAYEEVIWGQRAVPNMVGVVVAAAERDQVCELLEDAWRQRAPKRLVAAYDARRGTA